MIPRRPFTDLEGVEVHVDNRRRKKGRRSLQLRRRPKPTRQAVA